jgi:putative Mg2+ transporter-C (MgtC) family protein
VLDVYEYMADIMAGPLMENVLVKLAISALFGLIIGLDRELKKKPLGLKTCLVLSVSSCLLTIVSIESAYEFPKNDNIMMDPLRLAAQIVSGVGFIGAGVILKRSNEVIVGLTTAAMIWGASGIGIAVGAGYYIESTFGLLMILFGVDLLPPLLKKWGPKTLRLRELDMLLTVMEVVGADIEDIFGELEALTIKIKNTTIKNIEPNTIQLQMRVEADSKLSVAQIFKDVRKIEGVLNVDIRSY